MKLKCEEHDLELVQGDGDLVDADVWYCEWEDAKYADGICPVSVRVILEEEG